MAEELQGTPKGITPELLYRVLQADIAVQLRCEPHDGIVSTAQDSDMPSESDASAVFGGR